MAAKKKKTTPLNTSHKLTPLSVPPAAQSERVMLALTPDEKTRLEAYAATVSESVGATVGVATVARSLLMRELRRVEDVKGGAL